MSKLRIVALCVSLAIIGCQPKPPAKACNGVGGVSVGVGGSFDQFGNPIGAAFAPSYGGFSSFQSFNTVPTYAPSFVNVNPSFGFRSVGFNSGFVNPAFGFNAGFATPAFATFNARGGLLGSRIRVGGVGFSPSFVGFNNAAFVNPAFIGFNSFNGRGFNNFAGFNGVGVNNGFVQGRFGAIRPAVVSRAGNVGVRGVFGGFHPLRANGVPTLLPRFR